MANPMLQWEVPQRGAGLPPVEKALARQPDRREEDSTDNNANG
jgi:hypothetical protein